MASAFIPVRTNFHYRADYSLKGSSDAHFPRVDITLQGLNEKSTTLVKISQW